MVVNWVGIVTAPIGQPNQVVYDVTDDGMIDDGNDVPANAHAPYCRDCCNNGNDSYVNRGQRIMMMIIVV